MIACFVAVVLLTVVSFFGGRLLLYCVHRTEPGCCETVASGSVMLFFGSFCIQLLALLFGQSYRIIKWGNVIYALLLVITGGIAYIAGKKKNKGSKDRNGKKEWKCKDPVKYGIILTVFALNVSVMLRYEPYFGNDMTVEETGTILETGTICRYHPGTGAELEFGMDARAKLNFMPGLYAVLCDITGAEPYLFICRWIPVWGLLLNYMAVFLLLRSICCKKQKDPCRDERDCRMILYAVILYGILLLFGDYQAYTYAFRLLHQGWNPDVILWASVVPMILAGAINLVRRTGKYAGKEKNRHAERVE